MKTIKCNQDITNNEYDIIVIDSGVNDKSIDAICIKKHNNKYYFSSNTKDYLNHGSSIVNIINKDYPKKILMIKIIDNENDIILENQLIYVLNYIYNNYKCKILNISLGISTITSNRLYNICKKISDNNTYITCAYSNNKAISYPAFFDCVFGIDISYDLKKTNEYIYLKNNKYINILAYGNTQIINKKEKKYNVVRGTSYACANFTRILFSLINEKNVDINNLLEKNSKYILDFKQNDNKFSPIKLNEKGLKRVAVFPFSKENLNIIRLINNTKINIVDLYDFKHSGKVNLNLTHLFNILNVDKEYIIRNIENIDISSFDTIVIGHINIYNDILKKKIIDLIELCFRNNKKVISYDSLDYNTHLFFSPKFQKISFLHKFMGKLFQFNTPVYLSLGTGSKEGKFTFQIKFKEYLNSLGYKTGFIGSEPNSMFFNCDDCIHCGYNSNINDVSNREMISNINYRVHLVDIKNYDIIIVGSQANILSENINNIYNVQLENFSYFLAVNPDVVTINIHIEDDINYIKRSIKYVESLNDCIVAGIIIFPLKSPDNKNSIISNNERIEFITNLKKIFPNIAIAFLDDDKELKDVFEAIITPFK